MSECRTTVLRETVRDFIFSHGSIRNAAAVLGVDHAYLHRLAHGGKSNPSDALLRKLNLRRVIQYERMAAPRNRNGAINAGSGNGADRKLGLPHPAAIRRRKS